MRLALTIQTPEVETPLPVALLQGSFTEKLEKAVRWGADGVELMTVDPQSLDSASMRSELQRLRLGIAALGSGALAFSAGLTLLNADPEKADMAQSRLRHLIHFAAQLGAPLVTIGSFRGRAAWVGESGKRRLAEILREYAGYAAQYGIRLALEPLNRYEADLIANVQEGLDFLKEVDHPALGLVVDTYHMNIEESSFTEPFRQAMAAGKLFHVHLGDNNRLYPGGGMIPFPSILQVLRETGYQGYLSAELLANPDPDTAAEQTMDYMSKLLGRR